MYYTEYIHSRCASLMPHNPGNLNPANLCKDSKHRLGHFKLFLFIYLKKYFKLKLVIWCMIIKQMHHSKDMRLSHLFISSCSKISISGSLFLQTNLSKGLEHFHCLKVQEWITFLICVFFNFKTTLRLLFTYVWQNLNDSKMWEKDDSMKHKKPNWKKINKCGTISLLPRG